MKSVTQKMRKTTMEEGLFASSSGTIKNFKLYGKIEISSAKNYLDYVGYVKGSSVVEKCMYFGNINLPSATDCIGGVVDYIRDNAQIINCANISTVKVSASGSCIGGILGYVNAKNVSLKNCYNYGTIKDNKSVNCGVIIGMAKSYDKNKLKSEMLTKEFVDELNSVTDDSVEWIYNANIKINNSYPTIKRDFYKRLTKNTSDGILVKGSMHIAKN